MKNKEKFPVEKMCKVMKIGRGSYYGWINPKPSKREEENKRLLKEIRQIYDKSRGTYGSPRITKELIMKGVKVSQKRIAKIMQKQGIRSKVRKKYKVTTDSSHKYPVVANKLSQNFHVKEIGKVWVSDITYIKTSQGWLYLTVIIDLADRKVIGWSLSDSLKTKDTVIPAWKMAIRNRAINNELIFHSDRGIQYACTEFTNHLNAHKNVIRSMSRKGNCWDNAVAESFFKTLKVESVYHNKFSTRAQAGLAVFEYIETWYNRNRRHSAISGLTILEYENLNYLSNVA